MRKLAIALFLLAVATCGLLAPATAAGPGKVIALINQRLEELRITSAGTLAPTLDATTAGTGSLFSWEFSNGDRLDVTATRTFSGVVPTLDVRAWYGDGFDYDGPAVMNIGYFYNDGGFIGDDQQWWGADNYGFVLGHDKALIWTDIDATYSDVTDTDREIALYSGSASTGMGRHILRLAGRAPGAVDPGFPWDASGIGTGSDLEPVYLSLAGIAPMRSSDTLILRDEGGDPALTVETTGELYDGTPLAGPDGEKALTDVTDVEVWRLSVPQGSGAGGTMALSVYATDGTDFQVHSEEISWAAVNKAGTVTAEVSSAATVDADADSTGTLTCTFDITEPVADTIALRINANTSLASTTTFRVRYHVISDTAGVTPQ